MTDRELKAALYGVFQKYRNSGFLSQNFKNDLNGYYTSPDPKVYIRRMQYLVELFDEGKGDDRYTGFISDVKRILDGQVDTSVESTVSNHESNADDEKSDKKDSKSAVETKEQEHDRKKVTDVSTDANSESQVKPRVKQEVDSKDVDVEVKTGKAVPLKQTKGSQKTFVKSKRTGKEDIVDMTPKTMKVALPNGLVSLFDKHIGESSKSYLLGSGQLSEYEANVLANSDNNASIFREHDFQLTRSDLFTILVLLALTHLNVSLKDGLVDQLFDYNDLKIEFYQQLANTNLVELDVQSRVREVQQKLEKSVNQNERIETMLGYLLLERANTPKDQNRETIKKVLDTSSIMNQAVDSFSVLDGIIGSKLASIKDYKRARGE